MTTKRPIPTTPALDRRGRSAHDTTDPARGERDHERAAAQWLYAWSYEALRPTGELLAARLTTPAVLRPGTVGRVSPPPPPGNSSSGSSPRWPSSNASSSPSAPPPDWRQPGREAAKAAGVQDDLGQAAPREPDGRRLLAEAGRKPR